IGWLHGKLAANRAAAEVDLAGVIAAIVGSGLGELHVVDPERRDNRRRDFDIYVRRAGMAAWRSERTAHPCPPTSVDGCIGGQTVNFAHTGASARISHI